MKNTREPPTTIEQRREAQMKIGIKRIKKTGEKTLQGQWPLFLIGAQEIITIKTEKE